MLKVKVKSPYLEFTLPESWQEVTLKQFLALHGRVRINDDGQPYYLFKDALECFCSDLTALHQLGAYEEARIKQRLTFLNNRPDFRQLAPPDRIAGIKPPTELGNCTLKQKWTIDQLIEDWTEEGRDVDFMSLSVPLLSVYLYPQLTGKPFTSEDQLEEVVGIIEALPVTEALPLSAFFFDELGELNEFWSGHLSKPIPKSPAERMADDMVPELEAYREYTMVRSVAKDRGISHAEAYQLAYSDFMETIGVLFFGAHWHYQYQQAQIRPSQQRN